MPLPVDETEEGYDLDVVLIDEYGSAPTCVLYPLSATEKELQTMWVRAESGYYTSLSDAR